MDNPRGNQGKSRGRGRGNNAQGGGDNRQNRSQPAQPPSGTAWGPPPGNSARGNARGGGGGSGRGRASAAPTEYQAAPSMRGRGNGNGQQPSEARAQSNEMPTNSAWAGRGGASAVPAGRGRGQPQTGPQIVQPSAAPAWGGNQAAASTGAIPRQQQQAPSAPVPVQERPQQAAAPSEVSRGAVRGRRVLPELIRTRPQSCVTKAGAEGTRVLLQTNYFVVRKRPEWSIGQYRVDFSPEVENVRVRRAYLAHHKVLLGGYIFDGTVLFTCTNLKEQMRDGYLELITRNREGEVIQIKIKHVGSVSATDATQIHVLNLILRRSMEGLNLQELSRNYYDPQAKICIRQYNLEIWPGYQTSVRQHEKDILLCAEIMHKVLRTDTVYNILMECTQNARGDYQNAFKAQVIGMVVLTDYNNKTYRVDDVDFSSTPLSTFSTRDNQVSYVQYYRERYNIQVRDHKQPMLISRPTEKTIRGGSDQLIVLIPELCRATGMTDSMRNDFHLMKAMSEHTRLAPDMRIERLRTFNRRLKETAESMSVLRSWNMDLDSNLLELPGRILKPQIIVFGNNRRFQCDDKADWTREFRNNSMFKHIDLKRWYVIVPRKNVAEIQHFVGMCIQAAAGMKMVIAQPTYLEIPDNRTGSYSQAIDNAVSNDIQMVMLTLVTQDVERYSCIKKKCCVDRPVPSQVVTLRTVAPRGAKAAGLMSVATKVVIQMNAKIMGAPWSVELPLEGLMTVGFDVCHSAREKNKSFGALVATMDINKSAKYFSNVTKHEKGEELSQEIAMSMTLALKTYKETHGTLPKFIMFYRDGVGDGQLHQVLQSEISAMKAILLESYKSAKSPTPPRFCFVIVSKRINTRYFLNGKNPPPGTVVDDIITLPERYDFFLVSQSVRQGTVSPTNYNVIFDTMGLAPDRIQQLTYKMTHLYYNWSGTCRVPAVCQYAHKLAFLVAESIHRAPSNVLEQQLYFL